MARILILTPQLPVPPHALTGMSQGTTIRNFNLLAGLAKNHTLTLGAFTRAAETQAENAVIALLQDYCAEIFTAVAPQRSQLRRVRDTCLTALPDMALRLWSPEFQAAVAQRLDAQNYDVVQIEGIEMAPYMPGMTTGLSGRSRPRLVFDEHNAEYVLQQRTFLTDLRRPTRWLPAAYSLVQWQKLIRYERRACLTADRIVAVSEVDRSALQRIVPERTITVIPNGVDLDFLRPDSVAPASDMGPAALVFTGKMDYRPNIDAVLWFVDEVLPQICAEIPETHFYIVGQQPHERLARLRNRPDITLTGRVPDVRPYIAGAAIYIVPLRIGGGTRLKVLEAMAMGRPMVSTRLGCDGFPFTDGREVRYADEAATFAATVVELQRDRAAAGQLGRAARAYVEAHYGWNAIVPQLERLYQ